MKKFDSMPGCVQFAIMIVAGALAVWLLFEPINRYGAWQWLPLGCRYIFVGLVMHFVFVRTKAKALKDGSFEALFMALFIIAIACCAIAGIGAASEYDESENIGSFVRHRNAYSIGIALAFAAVAGALVATKENPTP